MMGLMDIHNKIVSALPTIGINYEKDARGNKDLQIFVKTGDDISKLHWWDHSKGMPEFRSLGNTKQEKIEQDNVGLLE